MTSETSEFSARVRPSTTEACRPFRRPAWLGAMLAALAWALGPAVWAAFAADDAAKAGKGLGGPKWESLFDGKTLKGWKAPQFGGEGKVEVKDATIVLGRGDTMTGVTYTGKVPTTDYELTFEAKRVDGVDFFCTTTFPVDKSHCSLVVGGWGGPVDGLSSLDYYDAADNETTRTKDFKLNQWYRIRIRVTKEKIECWIDDEKMVDVKTAGRKISIRYECDLCRPLGISSWCTTGAVRDVRIRSLSGLPAEQPVADKSAPEKK